jgi:hypothetical protein
VKWGIDLGGTKISGIVFDDDPRQPVAYARADTEQTGGYNHILSQIESVVRELQQKSGLDLPAHIGIGHPGTTDPATGGIKNSNTQPLLGRPLITDLSARLGTRFVCANDANCFALAEAMHGAAKGYATVFGIIMGTGVGGGVVIDGRVLSGAHGIAGEWGHSVLEPGGHLAYSGHRGVVESVLAGPSLERFYEECTGKRMSLRDIVQQKTDLAAIRTVDRLVEMFGRAVAPVVNLLDPDAIVVGGGVSNVDALYERGPAEVAKWVFNYEFRTPILRAQLGADAGVFGAAMLA